MVKDNHINTTTQEFIMYKIESKKLPATRYYTSYSAARADCKVYGISVKCIKPVN